MNAPPMVRDRLRLPPGRAVFPGLNVNCVTLSEEQSVGFNG